jgi:hypothetical protein
MVFAQRQRPRVSAPHKCSASDKSCSLCAYECLLWAAGLSGHPPAVATPFRNYDPIVPSNEGTAGLHAPKLQHPLSGKARDGPAAACPAQVPAAALHNSSLQTYVDSCIECFSTLAIATCCTSTQSHKQNLTTAAARTLHSKCCSSNTAAGGHRWCTGGAAQQAAAAQLHGPEKGAVHG